MSDDHDQRPLVSIGVPVFNEDATLADVLDSLLAQEYAPLEILVCDNASSDATAEIARSYAEREPRISFHQARENAGASDNFNWAFRLAGGKYFTWASGHDARDPRAIGACVEYLEQHQDAVLCYPRTLFERHAGPSEVAANDTIETMGMSTAERLRNVIMGLSTCNAVYGLIRASALGRTRLFRRCLGSDHVLLAELSVLGAFHQLEAPLFVRRELRAVETEQRRVQRTLGDLLVTDRRARRRPYRGMYVEHLRGVRHASGGARLLVARTALWYARRWWRPLLVETFPRLAAYGRAKRGAGTA